MPITEYQRTQRSKHIGSSDMAAIMGLDPYRNAYDVWLDKTGQLPEQPPNQAMQAGTILETAVLDFAETKLGDLIRNQYRSLPEVYLGANVDAITKANNEPVEAKTSGLFGPLNDKWGEPETDEVPDNVVIQSHVHLIVTKGPGVCHIPAMLGGRGFCMYHVELNPELVEMIKEAAVRFWERHVVPVEPPPDVTPSLDVIKKRIRVPNLTTIIPEAVVSEWQIAKEIAKAADMRVKDAEARLLASLGEAEAAEFGDPDKWLTYFETQRAGYEVKPTSYRALRISKRKVSK